MTDQHPTQPLPELMGRGTAIPLPVEILHAFNTRAPYPSASSTTEVLPGGEGNSYLHKPTNTVFKPSRMPIEGDLIARILSQLPQSHPSFQSPQPLKSSFGTFIHDGWSATTYIPDVHALKRHQNEYTIERFQQIIVASNEYHACLRSIVISDTEIAYLRSGHFHVWARSHQAVWSSESDPRAILTPFAAEAAAKPNHPWIRLVERITKLRQRLGKAPAQNEQLFREDSQIIHGDLVGGDNVLFPIPRDKNECSSPLSHGVPSLAPSTTDTQTRPLIIDLSPTFAPHSYATGILIADGLIWCGIGPELIDIVGRTPQMLDMIRRGVLFRCLSDIGLVARGNDSARLDVIEIERVTGVLEQLIEESDFEGER